MTLSECKRLYLTVAENQHEADFSSGEWINVHHEMEQVVAAQSDRTAANVIRWWNCWDRKETATSWARKARAKWREMQG